METSFQHIPPRPPRCGGLATPLGVYMTSGYYTAGAGWKGLVATGVMFGVLMHILDWLWLVAYSALVALAPVLNRLDAGSYFLMQTGFSLVVLLAMFRLSPISGQHAAEHMTINAIENGLELTEPLVRTQPREHLRCGTNLMVLLGGIQWVATSLFFSYGQLSWVGMLLYASLWIFLIYRYWRPIGLWLQRHFTTKSPTSAQLASGIRAGQELLDKFAAAPHPMPNIARRIWGSGLVTMLLSFLLSSWIIGLLLEEMVR